MQRQMVIDRLRERGCRITKQRLQLLDIILEEECACCKEIYIKAASVDNRIGLATVYRMINLLEEIGAISRKNMYKIACERVEAVTVRMSVCWSLMMTQAVGCQPSSGTKSLQRA